VKAFVTFLLAIAIMAVVLPSYSLIHRLDPSPPSALIASEKKFYAASDIHNSMFEAARVSLSKAKKDGQALHALLLAAGVPASQVEGLTQSQLSRKYVYLSLLSNSRRLKQEYAQYGAVFWCGPSSFIGKGASIGLMESSGVAVPCPGCLELSSPQCENSLAIMESADGSYGIAGTDPSGTVPVAGSFGGFGLGFSLYDHVQNSASIHYMSRIYEAKA